MRRFTESIEGGLQFPIDEFTKVMHMEWERVPEYSDLYEIIDVILDDVDLGKGIEHKTSIIKRLSDVRFFEFKYSDCDDRCGKGLGLPGLGNPRIIVGKEVFPHTVTKIEYW